MKQPARTATSPLQLAILLVVGLACTAIPAPTPAAASDCFAQPSACGYPDATNTGVPSGTALHPSGSLTLSTDGQVLEAVDLVGTVTVTADDVTIRNSKLSTTGAGETAVIDLALGAEGFTLEDSEVGGNGSTTNAPESNIWNHYWQNAGMRVIRSHLYGTPDNIEGRVDLVKNSFLEVDASRPGSHDENIFVWCTTVDVQHSTLFNYHEQTATVFGETNGCNGNRFTVEESLLAGGGYILYPQSGDPHPIPDAQTTVVGNRFARCVGTPVYNSQTGGSTCQGGADSHGIYPYGGYFGLSSALNGPTVWRENVWDDEAPAPGGLRDGSAITALAGARPAKPSRVRARWRPPARIRAHQVVVFDGTRSSGQRPLRCLWTIANRTGSIVYGQMRRCRPRHRFGRPGVRYVRLRVSTADGSVDSLRRRIRVLR